MATRAACCSLRLFRRRLFPTLSIAMTKVFLGGFCWQLFAFFVTTDAGNDRNFLLAVTAGLGDAFGVFVGQCLLTFVPVLYVRFAGDEQVGGPDCGADKSFGPGSNVLVTTATEPLLLGGCDAPPRPNSEAVATTKRSTTGGGSLARMTGASNVSSLTFNSSPSQYYSPSSLLRATNDVGTTDFFAGVLPLCCGCFFSGTAWQPALNLCVSLTVQFNAAMCAVGTICGLCFFVGYQFGILLTTSAGLPPPDADRDSLGLDIIDSISDSGRKKFATRRDLSLAFAIASACAFFVGTDSSCCANSSDGNGYGGNWLQPLVGERDGHRGRDELQAGLSTMIGFLVGQSILNVALPDGWSWLDV